MRDLVILAVHLLATIAKLLLPGGARSVLFESLLLKHQLLILNRSRARAPNLRPIDRIIASVCAGLMRPARLLRSAILLKPSTLMVFHRALVNRNFFEDIYPLVVASSIFPWARAAGSARSRIDVGT